MVTWVGVGLHWGVTRRSWQGHLKVTARSNQLKIGENNQFLLVLLQFSSLEMSMVVENPLDSSMEIWPKHPRGYSGNISAGGVIPHQMTLMPPLSHIAEMDQIINSTIVMLGPMATTSNTLDESQTKYTWWHGLGLGFKGVLPQGHDKVISRSQQGQISLKFVKMVYCSGLAPILLTWDVYGGFTSHSLQHGNIPKHPTRLQG